MMKTLLTLLAVFLFVGLNAQYDCKLLTDSIIDGDYETEYQMFYYNVDDMLVKVERVDSGMVDVSRFDTVFYSSEGLVDSVYKIDNYSSEPREIARFGYDGSNRINRIELWGDNGSGPWTMAHNVTYDVSGNISSIELDAFSISGDPEGFMASFKNIVWSGGNFVSADLIGDMGGGVDTLEMVASHDTKSNIEKHFLIDEAPDLLMHNSANNILELSFANDEDFGPAGTIAMHFTYTYNMYDEVETRLEHPGVFNSDSSLYKYRFACEASGVNELENQSVHIYPNPVSNELTVEIENSGEGNATLVSMSGQVIFEKSIQAGKLQIDVSNVPAGLYLLKVQSAEGVATQKITIE